MELIVSHLDREEKVHLERTPSGYRVVVGEATYDVDVASAGGTIHSLLIAGSQHEVSVGRQAEGLYRVSTVEGTSEVELMDPLTYLARAAHQASDASGIQKITAYMPGRVVDILVAEGDEVQAGQGIVVLEAMKMKNEIQAESAGVVGKILVDKDQAVEAGDPLVEIA